jgi:catechol 2,3-dioxygenase-like lactoylglutathione lyase family enzyme
LPSVPDVDHLAIPVRDQERSRRFYEAHFGVGLADRDAVLSLRDRFAADGVELVEEWDEPDYVSVKCRDPDGYIVEASWEP